ncbi:MAG: glutathione binding-like protein [Gammaproteobacteria bacterium]|jgi:GST-like protein
MIELYYWPTPNGHKITMFLEETGLEYRINPVNIHSGDQFKPAFVAISPNNRMPAIIDTAPADGGEPVSVFESGAILVYVAEKTEKLLPQDLRGRTTALQWLFWQVGGLGPMAGQNHHFSSYAAENIPYAVDRYVNETNRLYGVLDTRLEDRQYLVGENYTIADIAVYPWIVPWKSQHLELNDFPNVKRWFERIRKRPATVRAYRQARPYANRSVLTAESRRILFGQSAASVRARINSGNASS